jgi:hypothetical protein
MVWPITGSESYVRETVKSMKPVELAAVQDLAMAESARGISPEPLTDPDMNLSIHPARAIQWIRTLGPGSTIRLS